LKEDIEIISQENLQKKKAEKEAAEKEAAEKEAAKHVEEGAVSSSTDEK
jgi:hypothetical protein